MTNADRIRKMSDEELVALFCAMDSTYSVRDGCNMQTEYAVYRNKEWLSEEAVNTSNFWTHYNRVLQNIK